MEDSRTRVDGAASIILDGSIRVSCTGTSDTYLLPFPMPDFKLIRRLLMSNLNYVYLVAIM